MADANNDTKLYIVQPLVAEPEQEDYTGPGMRSIPQQGRAKDTKTKIREAGISLFSDPEHGRERTTSAQVAELAGVSIGTFYRYYADIQALLDDIWPDRLDVVFDPDIRPKLISAAREVLASLQGDLEGFTAGMVAKQADVKIAVFYRNFDDEQQLIEAINPEKS